MKREKIKEDLQVVGIMSLIVLVWQVLNVIILGRLKFNSVELIIAGILTISLYYNLEKGSH